MDRDIIFFKIIAIIVVTLIATYVICLFTNSHMSMNEFMFRYVFVLIFTSLIEYGIDKFSKRKIK